MNGRCDAEVGKPGGLWKGCRRRAVVRSWHDVVTLSGTGYAYSLEYCKRHEKRAGKERVGGITRVEEIKQ